MAINKAQIREARDLLTRVAQIMENEKANVVPDSEEFNVLENTQEEADALAHRLTNHFMAA